MGVCISVFPAPYLEGICPRGLTVCHRSWPSSLLKAVFAPGAGASSVHSRQPGRADGSEEARMSCSLWLGCVGPAEARNPTPSARYRHLAQRKLEEGLEESGAVAECLLCPTREVSQQVNHGTDELQSRSYFMATLHTSRETPVAHPTTKNGVCYPPTTAGPLLGEFWETGLRECHTE